MLNVINPSVIFSNHYTKCCYAEGLISYCKAWMSLCWVSYFLTIKLNATMLSVSFPIVMLYVIMLSVTFSCYTECHYAGCHTLVLYWMSLCWVSHFLPLYRMSLCWMSNFLIVILNVILINVSFPYCNTDCRFDECRTASL